MQCSHAVPIFGKLTEFRQNRKNVPNVPFFTEFARFRVKVPIFLYFLVIFSVFFHNFVNFIVKSQPKNRRPHYRRVKTLIWFNTFEKYNFVHNSIPRETYG